MYANLQLLNNSGSLVLRANLLFYHSGNKFLSDYYDGTMLYNSIGKSNGEPLTGQSLYFDGSTDINHASIVGTETVTNDGTASLTIAAGKIQCAGGGYAWNIEVSNGLVITGCKSEDEYVPATLNGVSSPATMSGGSVATFYHQTAEFGFDPNEYGYSLADGTGDYAEDTVLPHDPSDTSKDILGNTLQYPQPRLHPKLVGPVTIGWDGSTELLVASLVGTETVTDSNGTSTVAVAAGKLTFTTGWCTYVELSNGSYYVIENEEGYTGDQVYDISANEAHGTISGTAGYDTVAEGVRSYLVENGWWVDPTETIPGYVPTSSTTPTEDVLGNALTTKPGDLKSIDIPGFEFVMPETRAVYDMDAVGHYGLDPINTFIEADGDAIAWTYDDLATTLPINGQYILNETRGYLALYSQPIPNLFIPDDVPKSEALALINFYLATNGADWTDNTGWLSDTTVGNWYGVTVSGGHVTKIDVNNNNVVGAAGSTLGPLAVYLTTLYCYNNNISTLDVSSLTSLDYLHCGDNSISTLDIASLTSLNKLYCYSNNISTLDVALLTSLTTLYCYNNNISTLDVSSLTSLDYLHCSNNNISTLDIASLTSFGYLNCYNNNISVLDVSSLTSLGYLNCGDNSISTLDVSSLTSLDYLHCGDNSISTLDIASLTSLTELYCYNNNMTEAMVDTILCGLDTAGATGGTCNISGTNAAPSATGLTCKTNLETDGWTVTVTT